MIDTGKKISEFARLFGLFLLYGEVEDHESPLVMKTRVREIMEIMMTNMAVNQEEAIEDGGDFYEGLKEKGGSYVTELVDVLQELLAEKPDA